MIEVAVTITPALVRLNRLAGRFTNFKPVLGGKVDVIARRFMKRRFESEGRVGGGGKWQKLTPRYAAWKFSRVPRSRKILQLNQTMYNAFTKRGAPMQRVTSEKDEYSLTVTGKVQMIAMAHTSGAGGRLPVRVVVPDPLPKTLITELRQAIRSYVVS